MHRKRQFQAGSISELTVSEGEQDDERQYKKGGAGTSVQRHLAEVVCVCSWAVQVDLLNGVLYCAYMFTVQVMTVTSAVAALLRTIQIL